MWSLPLQVWTPRLHIPSHAALPPLVHGLLDLFYNATRMRICWSDSSVAWCCRHLAARREAYDRSCSALVGHRPIRCKLVQDQCKDVKGCAFRLLMDLGGARTCMCETTLMQVVMKLSMRVAQHVQPKTGVSGRFLSTPVRRAWYRCMVSVVESQCPQRSTPPQVACCKCESVAASVSCLIYGTI